MTTVNNGSDRRRTSKKAKMPKHQLQETGEPETNRLNMAAIQDDEFADEGYSKFAAGVEDHSADDGAFRAVLPLRPGGLVSGISQQLLLMSIAEEVETGADTSMRGARLLAQRQRSKVSSAGGDTVDSYEYGDQPTKETTDEFGGRMRSSQLIIECSDDQQQDETNSTPGSVVDGLVNGGPGNNEEQRRNGIRNFKNDFHNEYNREPQRRGGTAHNSDGELDRSGTLTNKQKLPSARRGQRQQEPASESTVEADDLGSDVRNNWFQAVVSRDMDTVERLIQWRNQIIHVADERGRVALHIAVLTNQALLVDKLIAAGAWLDIRQESHGGQTPLHLAARTLNRTIASRLLAAGADPNIATHDDGTVPLHLSCQHGDGSRLVRLLLRHGARPDPGRRSRSGRAAGITPLHDAADAGDLGSVRALLDADPSLADRPTDRGCTALHVAARHGRLDVVSELIGHGRARVDQPGSDSRGYGVRPLHLAAENGHPEAVKLLIEGGADPDLGREYCGKTGVTALHLAVTRGHDLVVRVLLTAGAKPDPPDSDGTTPLHVAARSGLVDIASALLERRASTDIGTRALGQGRNSGASQPGAFNQTPLHFAVRYRHLDVIRLLLQAGCAVNVAEKMPVSPIQQNALSSHKRTGSLPRTETIVNGNGTVHHVLDGYTALHWAVEVGDIDAVCLLMDYGADVNKRAAFDTHFAVSPLHLAAQDGYTDIVDELLRRGAERDPRKRTRNRENITPLHQAAYNGHVSTVRALVQAGCDVNVQADNGYAAIHYAAQKGSLEMIRAVLDIPRPGRMPPDLSLRASTKDQSDISALHLAVQSGRVDVIRALVQAKAPIDPCKKMSGGIGGVTPLHQAVYQDKEDIVAALLELGADPDRSMNGWYRPLHVAAERGTTAIAVRLIKAGATVDARASMADNENVTALHVAAQHGHSKLVPILVSAGAELRAVRKFGDRSGITPLHLATENGFHETVQAILELASATMVALDGKWQSPQLSVQTLVNAQDSFGFSSLHLAVQYQFPDIVQTLLAAGADVSMQTASGSTPSKIASELASSAIRELLRADLNSTFGRADGSLINRDGTFNRSAMLMNASGNSGTMKSRKKNKSSLLCGVRRRK